MAITLDGTAGITSPTVTSPAIVLSSGVLGSAVTGELEYDGKVPYFTPQGLERGVVPGMQYYRLNSALAGANTSVAQNIFGVGVSLSSDTIYEFEAFFPMSKTAGTTSNTISFLFAGTATLNNIGYNIRRSASLTSFTDLASSPNGWLYTQVATATVVTGARTNASYYDQTIFQGTVSVSVGGTFIPQYKLSAAPGGAYTTALGSYFLIYPVGAAGSNTSVGDWS